MMSGTPQAQEAFSHKVAVADVPASGIDVTLEPGEAERAVLARHVGVLGLPRLVAHIRLAPEGGEGVQVTGRIEATVRQTCVVSLEAFESELKEALEVHFAPPGTTAKEETEGEEAEIDPPDEIVGGVIDVGALVGEFLALGVDPYPRKPGAVFEVPPEDAAAASPFAALAQLKDRR